MNERLRSRFNQILPSITSEQFLSGKGLGNEIAFYIFDYPPEDELDVRQLTRSLVEHIRRIKPALRIEHINLFKFITDYLKEQGLLEKAFQMQKEKGGQALLKALKGVLHEEKIARRLADHINPNEKDLVLLSGVGSCYPLLRSHTLLNNLHPLFGHTPMVMFYPGRYDKTSLRLFGKTGLLGDANEEQRKPANYYRAFKLVE